jgi:hypothetical protein
METPHAMIRVSDWHVHKVGREEGLAYFREAFAKDAVSLVSCHGH